MIDVKGKRIYLSGPMSMRPNYNVSAFAEAHALLKVAGARDVYDPALAYLMRRPEECDAYEHGDWVLDSLHELTRRDVCHTPPEHAGPRVYDMVVQLPGWDASEGAVAEAAAAGACGIPCYEIEEVLGHREGR